MIRVRVVSPDNIIMTAEEFDTWVEAIAHADEVGRYSGISEGWTVEIKVLEHEHGMTYDV